MSILIKGGPTNAGKRAREGSLAAQTPKQAWTCVCGRENKGSWLRCFGAGCNRRRP